MNSDNSIDIIKGTGIKNTYFNYENKKSIPKTG